MATATEETTKSAELKQKLQERLEAARERFDEVREDIAALRDEDKENIHQKAAEIRQRIVSQKERVQELRDQASGWLREKQEQTEDAIMSWRQKREIKRLENRAERAEEYAVNVVFAAMMYADEAEVAMLDALEARLDADAAVSGN